MAANPDGTRVASARGAIPAHEIRNALLFASAEATLETGDRFFRVMGAAQHGSTPNVDSPNSPPPPNVAGASVSLREGDMVFAPDPGPADGQDVRDAVVVVLSSQPELRLRLSEPARRQLELFKLAAK
ncbi:MAG TPA: hypothetical protein VE129_06755 [Thermoanaerobaculia bacterium]|nr:hypothetical protein [Thermoanaerobaculia bacterium]